MSQTSNECTYGSTSFKTIESTIWHFNKQQLFFSVVVVAAQKPFMNGKKEKAFFYLTLMSRRWVIVWKSTDLISKSSVYLLPNKSKGMFILLKCKQIPLSFEAALRSLPNCFKASEKYTFLDSACLTFSFKCVSYLDNVEILFLMFHI